LPDISPIISVLRDHNLTPPPHMEMIVESIAQDYQNNTAELKGSLRITGVINDLQAIANAATRLGVLLKELHPQTSQVMGMSNDWPLPGQLPPMELDKIIDSSVLSELSTENEDRENVGLLKNILDLSKLAAMTKKEIVARWEHRREDGKLDAGGKETILSISKTHHPKLVLARSCQHVLSEDFNAVITSNPNDLFYQFFAAVFEYASDKDPEGSGAGLERYVKLVTKETG